MNDDFENDVRGKLIYDMSKAIAGRFKVTPDIALILTGIVLQGKGYVSIKEGIVYLTETAKTPVSHLDELGQQVLYYLGISNVSGN